MEIDNSREEYLKNCFRMLLTGLDYRDVDLFMECLTPDNSFRLGQLIAKDFKRKVLEANGIAKDERSFRWNEQLHGCEVPFSGMTPGGIPFGTGPANEVMPGGKL